MKFIYTLAPPTDDTQVHSRPAVDTLNIMVLIISVLIIDYIIENLIYHLLWLCDIYIDIVFKGSPAHSSDGVFTTTFNHNDDIYIYTTSGHILIILLIYPIYYQWTYTGNITDISNILPVDI